MFLRLRKVTVSLEVYSSFDDVPVHQREDVLFHVCLNTSEIKCHITTSPDETFKK